LNEEKRSLQGYSKFEAKVGIEIETAKW